ncbi:hypothetical protein HBI12_054220 [Parastagonospora nodorum]|nr:hypothetical protein HBI12_054220 [Parastagonospora nodorum]KAH5433692.1 hypothetical protein HBI47_087380 [Parastagonospora nodorum]
MDWIVLGWVLVVSCFCSIAVILTKFLLILRPRDTSNFRYQLNLFHNSDKAVEFRLLNGIVSYNSNITTASTIFDIRALYVADPSLFVLISTDTRRTSTPVTLNISQGFFFARISK